VAAVVPSVEAAAALPEPPDLVIVAVRQYDIAAALGALAALPDATVVTAQNGVGAEEAAAAARPPEGALIAASVTASVERTADGTIRWLRRGGVGLAPVRGPAAEPLASLATVLRGAGVRVAIRRNAAAMKWSKLLANLVGNATSGLLDTTPSAVYADARLFRVEREQLREALAVMRALELPTVALPGAPVPLLALAAGLPAPLGRLVLGRVVGSARGGKDPSLRGAVTLGGRTEAGWLNGAVASAGVAAGVPTPVNAALARLVDEAAAVPARREWFRGRPDRLLAALDEAR
jgi:2-dehydropantoate 2-reductase